jgi:hypothetical protein
MRPSSCLRNGYNTMCFNWQGINERAKLYDFIVAEMTLLAKQHPHRIGAIITSLHHQRDALLDVANALNDQFAQLATQYKISIDTIWKVCYTAR